MTCVVLVLDTDEINDSLLLYVIVIACKLGSFVFNILDTIVYSVFVYMGAV